MKTRLIYTFDMLILEITHHFILVAFSNFSIFIKTLRDNQEIFFINIKHNARIRNVIVKSPQRDWCKCVY